MTARRFGDIGAESASSGYRTVMWVAPDQVMILTTPDDEVKVGDVTYSVMTTEWGDPRDLDAAEFLGLLVNDPNAAVKLLK